jgi:hypothetical protein
MNGSAGLSRQKKPKQELAGSNGAVPASETESGDPVAGLAVPIVENFAPVSVDGVYAGHCPHFVEVWLGAKPVKEVCKRICKRTTQHSMARSTTSRDHRMRNAKLEHTVSY